MLAQKPVVCVLALTAQQRAVLVRQFRPGPERVMTELPAGFIEDGESPLQAAERELREETGYRGSTRELATLFCNGYSTEQRHVFICSDATRSSPPEPDAGEEIEIVEVDLPTLRSILREGGMTVTDACFLALDALGLLGQTGSPVG